MVSIIVPIYKEKNLNTFLEQFLNLQGEFELIFVSGDNNIYDTQNFKLLKSKKGRGAQMNIGVKHAKYPILWFLHADSKIEQNSILKIENFLKTHELGAFKIKFDSNNILMKICAFMSNLRLKFRNIAFGDQGMFIKKELFYKLRQFKEIYIMEDYDFSIKAKKNGFKFKMLDGFIITSSRRFIQNGILKTMVKMQLSQLMFKVGFSDDKIERFYHA